jgi:3-phenylpropionate/trans-cinnamate dioxygenase ferredoxin reductase subunit
MGTTLIVGASQAGVQIAATMRELGDTDPIILVGEEPHRPYQRPPLSKKWLKSELVPGDVILRTREWFDGQGIELISADRVVTIHRNEDGSGEASTQGGRRLHFDRLALATGSSVRRLTIPGTDFHGVHYLRDADDALSLEAALHDPANRRVVVIGGGFIGLEIAAVARSMDKEVTVLEAAPRLVGRVVSEETSAFYLDAHQRRGAKVVLGASLKRIIGGVADAAGRRSHVVAVELADGTAVPADLVVIGIGVIARTELAVQLGLAVDGGIVVDEHALASDGRTVAAGDCTVMPNPYALGIPGPTRIESVNNALEQAKIAAASLLGERPTYRSVPWFWSDQADLKLQIAGLSTGYDQVVVRGRPDDERFAVLYYREGALIAADCVNQPAEFLAIRNALSKGHTITPEAAADTDIPLKQSITEPLLATAEAP